MKQQSWWMGKVVVVVGATGGLGGAVTAAVAARGGRLVIAGRNVEMLSRVAAALLPEVLAVPVDVTEAGSIESLRDRVLAEYGRVDVVINAAGMDVRKLLSEHSPAEIQALVDINLKGAVLLTQLFLPALTESGGTILHVGGFGDGRLAFPYYSVDVATRAAMTSFAEAMNRELRLTGSPARVAWFGPNPTDTAAERPFHPLWRQMGVTISPMEQVTHELLQTVERGKRFAMMGGAVSRVFAALNAVWPAAADRLMLDHYGRLMRRFFGGAIAEVPSSRSGLGKWLGAFLVIFSGLPYLALLGLPFLDLPGTIRLVLVPALLAVGELTFWVGCLLVGKEIVGRYRERVIRWGRRLFCCRG